MTIFTRFLSRFPQSFLQKLEFSVGFLILVLVSVVPKLYQINNPSLNDINSDRQLASYAIAERMYLENGSFFYPKTYQAINPLDSMNLHFAEVPVYEATVVVLFKLFGPSVLITRLANIFLSVLLTFVVYQIGKLIANKKVGFLAAIFFSLFPATVFWGRTPNPEILALLSMTLAILLSLRATKRWSSILAITFFATLAVVTKAFYIAYLPLCLYIVQGIQLVRVKKAALILIVPIASYLLWRQWGLQFPYASWILTDHSVRLLHNHQGWINYYITTSWISVFFRRYFFGQLFTATGGLLTLAGLALSSSYLNKKYKALPIFWAMSSLAITFIAATGSDWHFYYSTHWLPIAALLSSIACWKGYEIVKIHIHASFSNKDRLLGLYHSFFYLLGTGLLSILLIFGFGRDYFLYRGDYFTPETNLGNAEYLPDYQHLDQLLPKDAKLVSVQYLLDPTMFNTLHRIGFAIDYGHGDICPTDEELVKLIDDRQDDLKPSYLLIDQSSLSFPVCDLKDAEKAISKRYPLFYGGKKIHAYKL